MPRREPAPPLCSLSPVAHHLSALRAFGVRAHIVRTLRHTVRRRLASGSALARLHRTLDRHACAPDALRHRHHVPTHRAAHRHPPPTLPPPVASPLRTRRLPHASPPWSRLLPDDRSHRRPVLTDRVPQTHALSSVTRLGPDRLPSCHSPCLRRSRFGSHT